MTVHVDQVYREVGGTQLRYDFFRPDSNDQLPLLIGIHGGGWISGSKEDYRDVAMAMVQHGIAVACPNYRLAPLHPYPAAVEDVRNFVAFVRANAESWAIDPMKVAAFGNSAGGHLAAMLGVGPDASERVNAVVDVCGITDVTNYREQHLPISFGFLEQFLPLHVEGNEAILCSASPIYQVAPGLPPFLVIHGTADDVVPISQSDTFVEKLEEQGVPFEYHRLEGEGHSFSFEAWNQIETVTVDFLREVL